MTTHDEQMERYREPYTEPSSGPKPRTTHDIQTEQLQLQPLKKALNVPPPEPASIMESLAESLGKN